MTGSGRRGQLRLSGGRRLQSPRGKQTRPTTGLVRAAVINMLADRLRECHWLELCSGSGVMSCEAIERGAQRVVAIERDRGTAAICRINLMATASGQRTAPHIEVIQSDLRRWLNRGRPKADPGFDLVYFDPPYEAELYLTGLEALRHGNWLRQGALVICEHASNRAPGIPEAWWMRDQRRYGNSSVLILSLRERCRDGIDSRRPQTDPAG